MQGANNATATTVNLVLGENAYQTTTFGNSNTVIRMEEMFSPSTTCNNTSLGFRTLNQLTTSIFNSTVGVVTLFSNQSYKCHVVKPRFKIFHLVPRS